MYSLKNDQKIVSELLTIRLFEKKILELYGEGKISGTTHTCIGQEEIPVAVMSVLSNDDYVFSNHRGHGHYLARFGDIEGLFAEIMGKEGAICTGVGGSQHIKKENYYSTGIQGESIPVSVGVALKLKREFNKNISVSFIGDGTWGEGAVYEALNMAALWQVPIVVVCENNGIAQTTPLNLNLSSSIEKRANAFGIDFLHISKGNSVKDIIKIISPAFETVRNNNSPLIIEIETSRLASHSKGDDTRLKSEIQSMIDDDWYEIMNLNDSNSLSLIEKDISNKINSIVSKLQSKPFVEKLNYINKPVKFKLSENKYVSERVVENLNRSLNLFLNNNECSFILGEDILDPYGGAFKVTKGLSKEHPSRVITCPISELGIAGVGNGLALAGQKVIVEFMFGDFVFLAFDQIINFASKTVSMYGQFLPHKILFRCPVGGQRGYGPTHSQSVQKFFIGIPNLDLYELSPAHDCVNLLPEVLNSGIPSMLFESKTLYPKKTIPSGLYKDIFNHKKLDFITSHIFIDKDIDALLICGGSLLYECLNVVEKLFLEYELSVHIINPFKIYPFEPEIIRSLIKNNIKIFSVEEGTIGGSWGAELFSVINQKYPDKNISYNQVCSLDEIIPSSKHLEELVLISEDKILKNIINSFDL